MRSVSSRVRDTQKIGFYAETSVLGLGYEIDLGQPRLIKMPDAQEILTKKSGIKENMIEELEKLPAAFRLVEEMLY